MSGSWAFRLRVGFWLKLTTVPGRLLIVGTIWVVWLVVGAAIQLAANTTETKCLKHSERCWTNQLLVFKRLARVYTGSECKLHCKIRSVQSLKVPKQAGHIMVPGAAADTTITQG